ncbi:MAG: hypothetical protein H0V81_15960 [Solirubrobacterales bacterium]|nr:hypothetical protein [Solirubrobacterales bacterium]
MLRAVLLPFRAAQGRRAVLGLALSSVLLVAGCGDGGKEITGTTTQPAPLGEAKQGGTLEQLGSTDVDFVDPGRTYFTPGYQLAYAIGRGLYGFKPGSSGPVPDLAEGAPEIGADGMSVTVKLRSGVKFAPPVNREVAAADVKYAFERAFSANVGGPYAATYFSAIKGAPAQPTKGVKPIVGIAAPDARTLVFTLTRPEAAQVAAALVMPITIPVPEEYAKRFDAKNPSTYNTHVAASGPYMVSSDAEGNLTGYKPGRSITLVRNPNWDRSTDYKPALLDRIKWKTNGGDASLDAQQVLRGEGMSLDTDPPAPELKNAVTKRPGQFGSVSAGGYRYFPLNTQVKPFDDPNVRKAVLAVFDRDAARKARGGEVIGEIATHFLPPDFPGHEEGGGADGPDVDFLKNPRGDQALAEKYMKAAGYPSGKYTGSEKLLVVGATSNPVKAQAQVAKAQLEKLGLRVELRLVPADAVYTEFCQVPAKKVAVCAGAAWGKDFEDPQSMLEPTFKGANIQPGGNNNNIAQLDDPKINAAMEKAAVLSGQERLDAYGAIDKMIVESAAAVPFVWDKTTIIWSKDVGGQVNPYYLTLDFTFTSRK